MLAQVLSAIQQDLICERVPGQPAVSREVLNACEKINRRSYMVGNIRAHLLWVLTYKICYIPSKMTVAFFLQIYI